jgi:hypothetical protein
MDLGSTTGRRIPTTKETLNFFWRCRVWPISDFLDFGWIGLNAIFGDYMTDVLHFFLEERTFLW